MLAVSARSTRRRSLTSSWVMATACRRRLWSAGRVWLSVDIDWDIKVRLCRSHDLCEAMQGQIEADRLIGC
jgi:hypothetical protein